MALPVNQVSSAITEPPVVLPVVHTGSIGAPAKSALTSSLRANPLGTSSSNASLPCTKQHTWHHGPCNHLSTSSNVTIPGFSSLRILARASIDCDGTSQTEGHIIVDPFLCTHKCLTVPPGLYTLQGGFTHLYVINVTSAPVTLKRGTKITNVEFTAAPIDTFPLPNQEFCGAAELHTADQHEAVAAALHSTLACSPIPNPDHKAALKALFSKFPNVLPSDTRPLGRTDLLEHSITLVEGATPVRIPTYRIPHAKRQHLMAEVQGMLDNDLIEPSHSPWSSPLLLVPKPDGSFRPVVDFRQLNAQTIPEPFPMPTIKSLLMDIRRDTTIFSSIDLKKGFLQVPLEVDSRPLTAFSTPTGHYQFKVAPMGLMNSPLSFCRLMALVLQGLLQDDVLVYLDDILVCSHSVEDHSAKLSQIFDRLDKAGLTINPSKCRFYASSLTFLGHTLSGDGIRPNHLKVEVIRRFPQPKSAAEVRRFLGIAGFYRSFIKDYGKIAAPLTNLLRKDVHFAWGSDTQEAFDLLKSALVTAPVLTFPDYNSPFHVFSDASNVGLGAVLMQRVTGKFHPIAYASRALSPAERRYHTTDREMLAAVWALRHFRDIIQGYKVTLWTDHNPLTSMFNPSFKDPHNRKARYQLTLQDFDVEIKYIKGALNTAPDALSRIDNPNQPQMPNLASDIPDSFPPSFARCHNAAPAVAHACPLVPVPGPSTQALDLQRVRTELASDAIFGDILRDLVANRQPSRVPGLPVHEFKECDGLLYRISRPKRIKGRLTTSSTTLVLPAAFVDDVLKLAHEGNMHIGIFKTIQWLRKRYYFPKLYTRVSKHVRACKSCPLTKGSVGPPAPCGTYDVPSKPWDRVFSDILSLPPSVHGHKYLILFVDQFSRYCELAAIPDKSSDTIAQTFHDRVICRHGCPSYLITDNAPEYTSEVIRKLGELLNIEKPNILPYRPQANSFSERLNRSILSLLRTMTDPQRAEWCRSVAAIQGAINGTHHSALGDTPDFILMGRDKRLPYDLLCNDKLVPQYSSSTPESIVRDMQRAWRAARGALATTADKAIRLQNCKRTRKHIATGDLVFHEIIKAGVIHQKLAPKFEGPFRVMRTKQNQAFCLNLSKHTSHWFHVDTLKLADAYYNP